MKSEVLLAWVISPLFVLFHGRSLSPITDHRSHNKPIKTIKNLTAMLTGARLYEDDEVYVIVLASPCEERTAIGGFDDNFLMYHKD